MMPREGVNEKLRIFISPGAAGDSKDPFYECFLRDYVILMNGGAAAFYIDRHTQRRRIISWERRGYIRG